MLSNKEIVCPNNLLDKAQEKKGVKVAVVKCWKTIAYAFSSRCGSRKFN
jgi:phosphate acetyltransferase